MMPRHWLVAGLVAVVLGGGFLCWQSWPASGDPRLQRFVHARPTVPIVFTSRSEPASLLAPAPEGEGYTFPGQHLWAAREGRLRVLTPGGAVRELSWGKHLPDGNTLIDVMSPTLSLDGKRVLFAGRKGGDDPGRFRLYEVGLDGSGLRQLTGGSEDPGCTAAPPLRWHSDGTPLKEYQRRAIDFDDVDPIETNSGERQIVFVSSRTPDLGRDQARRSTTLWILDQNGSMRPATANRNNDRWPFLLRSRYIAFSLWSRNREVINADRTEVVPYQPGVTSTTRPTDIWQGAFTQIPGGHFGMLAKPPFPVWRPRPLFVNRITCMTTFAEPGSSGEPLPLTVVQVPPGMLASVPSARRADQPLPNASGDVVRRGPNRDVQGRPLWLATPSPCPPGNVLLSGAPLHRDAKSPDPGAYALYLARDDWPLSEGPASAESIELTLLFDDPQFVDAEPVAAYARMIPQRISAGQTRVSATPPPSLSLVGGQVYRGPMGLILATSLDSPTMMGDLPGQMTDNGQGPIFDAPPAGALDRLRIYAARRDRFDDPRQPRIHGNWERVLEVPVTRGTASTWAPTDAPTVLAGFDRTGRVVEWSTAPRDKRQRQATFLAFAGDHYSLTQPGGKHFCVGCHPGHSGFSAAHHDHAEFRPQE